jgi:stage V sporulation protein D (sporulation-specific penicillin-binding protein)
MKQPTNRTKKRLLVVFLLFSLLIIVLAFCVGWVQVVKGEEYAAMAAGQQTRDVPIAAKRGTIYDREGEELAISAKAFSVWVRPERIWRGEDEVEQEIQATRTLEQLSPLLGIPVDELKTLSKRDSVLVRVAKYQTKETADAIQELSLYGVELTEEVKRYYPLGAFAAQALGSVTDDNVGLAGIELRYDSFLSGVSGRWIKSADVDGNGLAYGVEKYFGASDGLNVVLTIDSVIQHYVEKSIQEVLEQTEADRVWCMMMDPKTGDILAMAMLPEFDPNNPRTPLDEEEAAYLEGLSSEEKMGYWNKMWRNSLISDTYEPGSTFKLITTAIGLEERVTSLTDTFNCTGSIQVYDTVLRCWRYYQPHGHQTLVEAVGNSCNPVLVQIAQRVGEERYYTYLDLFGFSEKTNIDFPGESTSILQSRDSKNPVGLATMAYGQGIAVTPIQILSSVCVFGNEGKLMQPRLVKELTNAQGETVATIQPKVVRQVVSKQTSDEMCTIMESVVSEGGGGTAKVGGYRVGGKTGTAQKAKDGGYIDETYSSFIGMAPMDDPKVAILLVVDNPKGVKYGSVTAAPGAQKILADTLRYLNVEPEFSSEELASLKKDTVIVPSLQGQSLENAMGILGGLGLTGILSPEVGYTAETMVGDQYPKAGESIKRGTSVYLYWD